MISRILAIGTLFCLVTACGKPDDPTLNRDTSLEDLPDRATPTEVPFDENKQVYFGDLHIHTGLSTDAYILGVRSTPEDVYNYAKGKVIEHGAGYPIQISRPLDFAAVTDHAEYLGQARLANMDIPTNREQLGDILKDKGKVGITIDWFDSSGRISSDAFSPDGQPVDKAINKDAWNLIIETADAHNQPGLFTTFVGYEWSANAGNDLSKHLHRNVIYRSNNVSEIPFSSLDSSRPEDLWQFLDDEKRQGRFAMAIPHNGNFSGGYMYASVDSEGNPLTEKYARLRSEHEPISEILQIKGASETHPMLSSEDEFANFELLGESLFTQGELPSTIEGGYIRDALRVGMEFSHSEGFNPFKYGVIGSSDSHNASSPSDEHNYSGKLPMLDGSAGLRTNEVLLLPDGVNPVTRWGSGGLAGVWAESNTRASIYDALKSKETFATSGPRITVRFFGGWQFSEAMLDDQDMIANAYDSGVPMGGDLTNAPEGHAPGFLIMTKKDPIGANLDRVQIIKGWIEPSGESAETVYDIAAADDRTVDPTTGKLEPVGNTVDVANASYENIIGGTMVSTYWQDPDFNPEQEAFYYVRVLEIPTPRWSTHDAKRLGTKPMEPTSIQERAITSAIWYKP